MPPTTYFGHSTIEANANLDGLWGYTAAAYNPQNFGAKANGTFDDTTAIVAAIAATPAGGLVDLGPTGTYAISQEIVVGKGIRIRSTGATIKLLSPFTYAGGNTLSAFRATVPDVCIENIPIDATGVAAGSLNNRFLWWDNGALRGIVRGCRFTNLPGAGSNFNGAVGFGTGADEPEASGNSFNNCPGAVFAQGARARILNNIAVAPKDVSFVLNGPNATGGSIIANKVYANNLTCSVHISVEQGVSNFIIAENYIFGVKDGIAIGALSVGGDTTVGTGGEIANNVIDGGSFTSTNPCALIAVSNYYEFIDVHHNVLRNAPGGAASNTGISVSTKNNKVRHNTIRMGSAPTGLAAIYVTMAGADLTVEGNDVDAGALSWCVRAEGGDNAGGAIISKNNRYKNSTEGLNVALPTNCKLFMEGGDRFASVTTPVNGNGNNEVVGWQNYFNTYRAWQWPHCIREQKEMRGNVAPTAGTWQVGDRIVNSAPAVGQPKAWSCTVAGTPGTWVSEGNL